MEGEGSEEEEPSPPAVRSEDSLLAEQLMREEMEEAGISLPPDNDLGASLALAMELQFARGEEDDAMDLDVDEMTYEELLALGEESESILLHAPSCSTHPCSCRGFLWRASWRGECWCV